MRFLSLRKFAVWMERCARHIKKLRLNQARPERLYEAVQQQMR